ncbi:MAG: hypothetical protein N3B14_09700 [Thermoleophilia bacterium]|nr:hypothetical protein [Thermoleophilia bacterium]
MGENPYRISTSLVYSRVWIDPSRCNDCGECLSFEYWCPAQAIRGPVAGPHETVGSETVPHEAAAEKKYSKYIYDYDPERQFPPEAPFRMILRFDNTTLPGSHFYNVHWVKPHDAPLWPVGHPPHIHRDAELLFHIGTDPENPQDLGAEIELCLGPEMEKHIIDKSCVIYIPPNFIHSPWTPIRTWRPWIFIEVNQGPVHTEKGYHQLLPPEAIAADEHLSFFVDEGY